MGSKIPFVMTKAINFMDIRLIVIVKSSIKIVLKVVLGLELY